MLTVLLWILAIIVLWDFVMIAMEIISYLLAYAVYGVLFAAYWMIALPFIVAYKTVAVPYRWLQSIIDLALGVKR